MDQPEFHVLKLDPSEFHHVEPTTLGHRYHHLSRHDAIVSAITIFISD